MQKLIILLLFLAIPGFAQDTELPESSGPPKMRGAVRLSDEEKQRILREASLPPLPTTPEEKKQAKEEWERRKAAWGNKPIRIPLSEKDARELMGWKEKEPGIVEIGSGIVAVIFTLLSVAAYIKLRKEKGR